MNIHQKIDQLCEQFNIQNYTINDDLTVDAEYVEKFLYKLKSLGEKYKGFSTE